MKATLRITGGVYGGRRVVCPPGEIRPAMDRMRESMFAIIGDLSGCSFLDLFAGSGVVGLEAASRGATRVVSVEKDRKKREITLRNLTIAGDTAKLVIAPVSPFLRSCGESFDYVYLDPPFRYREKPKLIVEVMKSGCLSLNGVLMIHHPGDAIPDRLDTLVRIDSRSYGGSHLDFFRYDVPE